MPRHYKRKRTRRFSRKKKLAKPRDSKSSKKIAKAKTVLKSKPSVKKRDDLNMYLERKAPVNEPTKIAGGIGLPQSKNATSRIRFNVGGSSGVAVVKSFSTIIVGTTIPINVIGGAVVSAPYATMKFPVADSLDKFYKKYIILGIGYDISLIYQFDAESAARAKYIYVWLEVLNNASVPIQQRVDTLQKAIDAGVKIHMLLATGCNSSTAIQEPNKIPGNTITGPTQPSLRLKGTIYPLKHMAMGLPDGTVVGSDTIDQRTAGHQLTGLTDIHPDGPTSPLYPCSFNIWMVAKDHTEGAGTTFNPSRIWHAGQLDVRMKYFDPITIDQSNPLA